MMDRTGKRDDQAFFMGKSRWGIVTTAHYRATEAGVQMLAKGGNAIDAAVTAALALGVVEPAGSGLGGNAMAMVHLAAPKRTFVLEGPCLAPRKATPEIVAKYPRKIGYKSVAVPTNPCVLGYLLDKYGTIPRKTIFQPAIRMSEEGYTVTPLHYKLVKRLSLIHI